MISSVCVCVCFFMAMALMVSNSMATKIIIVLAMAIVIEVCWFRCTVTLDNTRFHCLIYASSALRGSRPTDLLSQHFLYYLSLLPQLRLFFFTFSFSSGIFTLLFLSSSFVSFLLFLYLFILFILFLFSFEWCLLAL